MNLPAHAQYIFDPADLPDDFECAEDASEEECENDKLYEAWYDKYHKQYSMWYSKLLLDTNIYFEDIEIYNDGYGYISDSYITPNLVDVNYSHSFGPSWLLAIKMECPNKLISDNKYNECEPVIRVVDFDHVEIRGNQINGDIPLPTSLFQAADTLIAYATWRDAELRSCESAIDHLIDFPSQKPKAIWHEKYTEWLRGKTIKGPDSLIVTGDGDGVLVRAQSKDDPESETSREDGQYIVYAQSNGGRGYDWAKKMYKLVEPCLKPSKATPPWQKVLDAEQKKQTLKQD